MKIALVGYGKMGQIIDKIAQTRGHEIVARLNESPTLENLNNPDVVIEFSSPESAFGNIKFCLEQGIPVVCGTTGWLEKKPEIEKEVKEAFKVVIKECKTANILEIDFSMEKHLKMADKAPIRSFAVSFQQNGYDVNVDDIEVYESKSSDVVQFIVKSTKKGEDSIFWVGNYNTLAHQVSISNYYGGKVGKAFG